MAQPNDQTTGVSPPATAKPPRRKRRYGRWIAAFFLVLILTPLFYGRPMSGVVRWYVNRVLSRNLEYDGRIGDVTLHLWRGSYAISDIRLFKRTGNVPVPLISIKRLELAVQWSAILHGKIVGQVVIDQPELNFVAASDDSESQTGGNTSWLQTLQDLFPFTINSAQVHDGSIHFRSYLSQTPVDVFLNNLDASVDNLTNIRNENAPLLTTINATALAMDQAKFEFHLKMDPFSYRPTFDMAARLIGLDVTKTNDLVHTYGQFEFKSGWFDLVIEGQAREGEITGYVKPLFRNLKVFDLLDDLKHDDNPLQFFWQALLGVATDILKNQNRDQFGTSIPFTGDMTAPNTDLLSAIGNVLRNAFIRAYLPRLDNGSPSLDGMEFQPATITDPTSTGAQQ